MTSILVVEDDPDFRKVLRRTLEHWGYSVITAEHGTEGWQLFRQNPDIRIAILDWIMPEPDGVKLTRMIREYEKREDKMPIYIILLTGKSGGEGVSVALKAGVDDYIRKTEGNIQQELESRIDMAEKQIAFETELRSPE